MLDSCSNFVLMVSRWVDLFGIWVGWPVMVLTEDFPLRHFLRMTKGPKVEHINLANLSTPLLISGAFINCIVNGKTFIETRLGYSIRYPHPLASSLVSMDEKGPSLRHSIKKFEIYIFLQIGLLPPLKYCKVSYKGYQPRPDGYHVYQQIRK